MTIYNNIIKQIRKDILKIKYPIVFESLFNSKFPLSTNQKIAQLHFIIIALKQINRHLARYNEYSNSNSLIIKEIIVLKSKKIIFKYL